MSHSLTVRLLSRVLLFSVCVTLILTLLQLYIEYRHDVSALKLQLDQISKTNLDSLAERLWALDEKQLRLQLTGILQLPDMRAVEVREAGSAGDSLVIKLGEKSASSGITREYPLMYSVQGQQTSIGTLYVQATLADIYHGLFHTAWTIFLNQAAETFLVALFIVYIFHNLVTRHLFAISTFVDSYRINNPPLPLRLQRPPRRHEDELQRVATAFNALSDNLQVAYRSLHDINEQWRAAFESNPTMYFIIEAAGAIVSVNAFGAEQLGYTVSDLVDQPVSNLFYKPDRDAVQKHANACFEQPGRSMRWEARKIRKDGTMLWVRETANAVFLKKRLVLLVVCEDITEQKRAEEAARQSESELRDVIETIPVMAYTALPDGSTEFVNRRFVEYTGLTAKDVGLHRKNTLHPDDIQAHRSKWQACLPTGEAFENEVRHRRANGDYRWFLVRAVPLRDEHGNILKWYGILTDIEDRKRAEDALRKSEERWRSVFENSAIGVVLADLNGRFLAANRAYQTMVGYTEEELRALSFLDVTHEDYHEANWALINELLEGKRRQFQIEKKYRRKDGSLIWVSNNISLVPGTERVPRFFMVLSEDITERKRAEEALRRSEAYLAEAQRLSKTGSWAWDPRADKMLYYSEEIYRIFGIDPQELAPSIEVLLQRVHPEDRDRVRAESSMGSRNKTGHTIEYKLLLLDGTLKYVLSMRHPVFDSAGQLVEIIGTTVDVTDRKRAEEEVRAAETRFRASVDHLTDGLFIHDDQDGQGRVVDVNQQACDSLGYTRAELIGMTAFDYDALVDATFMQSIKERLTRGEFFSFESAHRRKDGTVFPVEVRSRPFWHGDHRFGLALVRDITDRRRAEQERERLRQLEADLAHINRVSMMGELAASLAHEIKQPIGAAVTNADACLRLLDRDQLDVPEAREAALEMARDARRAADIIERVRSLYGKGSSHQEIVDVNEVIGEMVAMLHNHPNRSSVTIHAKLAESLPKVTTDRVQLQQVLMNLILNGIEAMEGTPGELRITSELADDNQLLISVTDTGMGLPADKADQIFNAFFTTKPHGTGLGLAISRSIVESHGGHLWASANPERGATFQFTLPNKMAADA